MKVVCATSRASNNETLNCESFLLYFQIPCYSCDFKSVKKNYGDLLDYLFVPQQNAR